MQNSNYEFRMMFAIWDLETNLRPAEIDRIGSFEISVSQSQFFPINNTDSFTSTPLTFHNCTPNDI